MTDSRLLIVANRLPVTIRVNGTSVETVPSSGGIASGLGPFHRRSRGVWFGWPGDTGTTPEQRIQVDAHLGAEGFVPVHLSPAQIDGYYHGFANAVLWPLFHYSVDRMPVDPAGWSHYREVNEAFAEQVAHEYRPGDTVWVHDYHLMLLPDMLRQRLPQARIGFFLHIPFPASEVFRVLPWRREILQGLLGADLIGFHTFGYLRHFMTSLLHIDGVEPDVDRVRVGDRDVTVGAFPMGIDARGFAALADDPRVRARIDALRHEAGGRRIVLGVDRLDYTKGIPRRLEAFARLFEREPALRDQIRYIQVAVPSRGEVASYQHYRSEVDETVGRMNGAFGTVQSLPIHYVHHSVTQEDLVALYGAADVMLVTPLRDGMNLVAKEFVASRTGEDGVLVLSEFAGASTELQGAITVNPYDVHAVADSIQRGLAMTADEQRARMRMLRRSVCGHDVFAWADGFLGRLHALRPHVPRGVLPPSRTLPAVLAEARESRIRLLLDYDGTLVPIARAPELAAPDGELVRLLHQLASEPGIDVDIVSGRSRGQLERWFGHVPVALWAEHGFWRRSVGCLRWEPAMPLDSAWMVRVKPILDQFAESTPGTHVEMKTASMAWHYRSAARDFGMRQAHELRLLLGDLLSNQPLEVLEGKKVIEVRMRGVGKGLVAQRIHAETDPGVALVAIGDDRTDEELFRALPAEAITVRVGCSADGARFRIDDHRSVRRLLLSILERDPLKQRFRQAQPA
jgi:trehalose 6-phosphate synthase/phosphatase